MWFIRLNNIISTDWLLSKYKLMPHYQWWTLRNIDTWLQHNTIKQRPRGGAYANYTIYKYFLTTTKAMFIIIHAHSYCHTHRLCCEVRLLDVVKKIIRTLNTSHITLVTSLCDEYLWKSFAFLHFVDSSHWHDPMCVYLHDCVANVVSEDDITTLRS